MNDFIKITLVANAGVHVEYNGLGILVDGVHHEEGHPFCQVSKTDLQHIKDGTNLFKNLDYFLFTHEHPDHFTPQYLLKIIQSRSFKGLFLPNERDGSSNLALLLKHARSINLPYWSLGLDPGEVKRVELADDLIVTAIGSEHMGPQYKNIRNDCFLLTLNGINLLFTGDADYVAEYYIKALCDVHLDAIFVNPIFYHNPNGQEIINKIFRPRAIVIYHMPLEQNDTMQFNFMVNRDIQRYEQPNIQTHILSNKKRSITLSASFIK
ncbi:MBL fold metallo-hydrolase [Desulfovibrio sp. UCD-KL4C]|uniref:MBL fold metallo-hydrolase n=1 Tax=Desulfovibrio sp. UCD-KL4C TaxID=2578120 RepID=UPI0025BE2DC8|nr:MBL fold metallo-hydrolase [Desulfovibrio sp. UCD-KL4C]